MLLNKKIKIALLFLVVFAYLPAAISQEIVQSTSTTQTCSSFDIKEALRKALFEYFYFPREAKLTVNEIKDLIQFYITSNTSQITIDCSGIGPFSGKPYYLMLGAALQITRDIPRCTDGTPYGRCSSRGIYYCYGGRLVEKCSICGCGANARCDTSTNKCIQNVQNITCNVNTECGTDAYVSQYFCLNNSVYRNYTMNTCGNPTTIYSSCSRATSAVLIDKCGIGTYCTSGQATCLKNVTDLAPSVAILIAPKTVMAGQSFNITVIGTDDVGLDTIWWFGVNSTDAALNTAHLYPCNNATFCKNTWTISTNAIGTFKIGANSRDTTYAALLSCTKEDKTQCPGYGEPHQASEGAGIAYDTVTVTSTPVPSLDIITIRGRWIDYFTNLPIVNAIVLTWEGTTRRDVYTNANGEFAINASTSIITTTSSKGFGTWPKCYEAVGFGVFRKTDNSLYANVNIFDLIGPDKTYPITTSEVNFGDTPFWPAVDIAVNTDIPVQFWVQYTGTSGNYVDNSGNVFYKTSHYLSNSLPLNNNARIKLIDSYGKIYYSPSINLPLSHGCAPVKLNFFSNQFSWNATIANVTTNCFVKVNGTVIKSVYATDRLDCYNKTSFGSINCQVYTSYFKDGVNFLEQYFGATDRVNNEYCSCLNGVCVQGITNQTCIDYDSGDNIFVASYAKKGTQAQYDKCGTAGQNYDIIEGVCVSIYDQLSGVPHTCPTGTKCKDVRYEPDVYANVSACVNESVTNQTTINIGNIYSLNSMRSNGIYGASVLNYAYPIETGVVFIAKGEEKNIVYGSRLAELRLYDGVLTITNSPYAFGNNASRDWYYSKYGIGAQPNHLSVNILGFQDKSLDKLLNLRLVTDEGEKTVYLPAVPACPLNANIFYIAKDGSTYYSRTDHSCGYPDLSPEEAIVPQHLARAANQTTTSCTKPLKSVSTSITNGGYSTALNSYFKIWAYSNGSLPENRYGYVDYSGWHNSGYDGGVWSIGKMYQSAKILVLKVRSEAPDFSTPIDFPAGTLTLTIDGSQFNINMPAVSSVCAKCNHWFAVFADGSVEKWPETDTGGLWINNLLTSCPSTNQTTLSPTGVCMVRDSYTSIPLFSAPDVGVGYAKKAIQNVNTIDGLRIACTNATFYNIMQSYCTQNSNPMAQELQTYSGGGTVSITSCGANGCSSYFCKYLGYPPPNSGVCMVSDAYTSISQIAFWDPDVGKGYAKMAKTGTNTISGLQASCTKADYDALVQKYCTQNSNSVQEGVITYGPGGGWTSSSCGAFGCNYRNCSTTTTPTTSDLVGYWKFDGNGNNEVAGGPNAVTVGNAVFYSLGGRFNGYAYIPSSSDYVKIPYSSAFDLPNSFTIEFWFRQRSNQSFNQNLVYKGSPGNNYNFYIFRYLWNQYNSGAIITGYTSSVTGSWMQTSNPNQLAHNVWHHVAFVKNSTWRAYYLDGVNTHSATDSPPAKTPATDIIIGDSAVDTDIDNLKIYNRALSLSEISNQTTLPFTCTDSDGGFNIYQAGLTDGRVNGIGEYFYDTCVHSNGGACSDPICAAVAEGYCANGKVTNLLAQCPNGCQNGACINQTNKSIKVLSPNGGETWYYNKSYSIQYTSTGITQIGFEHRKGTQIVYSLAPISATSALAYYVNPNSASTIGTGSDYKIRIYDYNNPSVYDESDATFSVLSQTTTLTGQCAVVDFENPPHLSFHLTWNPDLGAQDSYNYNLDETARQWLKSQGINITGTPNGIVWGTGISGPVGNTGVVVGSASPNFLEQDSGLSDNEQLTLHFLNASPKSVQVGLTTQPSDVSIINNVPSTVVVDAFDGAGNLVATSSKTFTGVTNGVYTPTKINVTASASNIAKINLRTTQHPYGGVYIEDVNSCI